jgi:phage terminase large subunit-like protein
VFAAELDKARAIRDGKQDGVMLPVLYELPMEIQADERQAWKNPKLWHMVTPNAGKSISIERLVEDMKTAELTSKEELRAWASQHLNIQIGIALKKDRWAGADFWLAAIDQALQATPAAQRLKAMLARCEVAVVGIDGGGLDDLLGLAVMGREKVTGKWLHWAHAWAHEIVLERRKDIALQLQDFVDDGDLTIVERPGDDVIAVADICCEIRELQLLPEKNAIGVDASGIADIYTELTGEDRGFAHEMIIGISQGWKMNAAIKTSERKVAGRDFLHCGSRLMTWAVSNARTVPQGNAITITKQASGSAKIDPLMATFDAVELISANPQPAKPKEFQMFSVA